MNGLEEIREYIKNFVYEKKKIQEQITKIEEKRTQLAQQRNEKKKSNNNDSEVNQIGVQIAVLGNESQELQKNLDSKFYAIKTQVSIMVDNMVAEGIRKIRIINEQIQELQEKKSNQKERNARYELQKQEFYLRFGRMPQLSENAIKECKLQEKDAEKAVLEIKELQLQQKQTQDELELLVITKKELKNGNLNYLIEAEKIIEEIYIEPLEIEEMTEIEEISVQEFEPIEELYIEEFEPIEEIQVEEFKEELYNPTQVTQKTEESSPIDEIEKLARQIIEEIVAEQTAVKENTEEDIITFEEEEENKERVIIPLFGQKATISTIIVKIEEEQLLYKAQMSDGEEIKIYPSKLGEESVLLRDKKNREECKEILINYATSEYKIFDKKVINKIDPLVCELLIECAEKYGYNAQELIYNYAMSFSDNIEYDTELVPAITYNLAYLEQCNLNKKEKSIVNKICRKARKNDGIDIIETYTGFKKIKYILKRIFSVNNVKVLPEAKY